MTSRWSVPPSGGSLTKLYGAMVRRERGVSARGAPNTAEWTRRSGAAALYLVLAGCASAPRGANLEPPAVRQMPAVTPAADDGDYLLQRGDVLHVKFYYNPELNELLPIRPDGKITLELVGDVRAAGLTAAALTDTLTRLYTPALRRTKLVVIVKEISRKIYVGGEVNEPGVLRPAGQLTVLQAIVEAGGFKNTAELRNVVVLRNQGTDEPQFLIVNVRESVRSGGRRQDAVLHASDIVFVPRTRIARMNQFVDQYVRQLIPVMMTLGVSYIIGDRVIP